MASYLITFSFQTASEESGSFIEAIDALDSFWKAKSIDALLFRDSGVPGKFTRLTLMFFTEQPVDEITRLIQDDPRTRELFQKIRDTKSRVLISFMEQVL